MHCPEHPDVETLLTCGSCGRPVCVACARHTIGIQCPGCVTGQPLTVIAPAVTAAPAFGELPRRERQRMAASAGAVVLLAAVPEVMLVLPFVGLAVCLALVVIAGLERDRLGRGVACFALYTMLVVPLLVLAALPPAHSLMTSRHWMMAGCRGQGRRWR